jgi:diketogulonate reductase-like aldo/keto reductase
MESILNQDFKLLSGYSMPMLGLGTWRLVGVACERIVRTAIELGCRHIDTAELYDNETEIGRAIRDVDRGASFLRRKSAARISAATM